MTRSAHDPVADFAERALRVEDAEAPETLACDWQEIARTVGATPARARLDDRLMAAGVKHVAGRGGAVACGSPHATRAGAAILEAGGNAVDAAVGACLALMVADVANTSIAGRVQVLIALAHGTRIAVDGATQVPAATPPLARDGEEREGFAVVPIPGAVPALRQTHRRWGRLPFAEVAAPAIGLARNGFAVPPHLGAIWAVQVAKLRADAAARALFLKADGSPYRAGEVFRNPALADVLEALVREAGHSAHGDALADVLVGDCRAGGGFLAAADLAEDPTRDGEMIACPYHDARLLTLGRQGWGHTVAEILSLATALGLEARWPDVGALAAMGVAVLQAFDDRPQEIRTLRPKPSGLPLERLVDPEFIGGRAERVRALLALPPDALAERIARMLDPADRPDQDTTHLSVIDDEGNAVALTTSIGPHFGAGAASRQAGVLFAYSQRMAASPEPGARDWTEMSPTIVSTGNGGRLAIGAAGSERIPVAIAQVLFHHIGRSQSLRDAMAAPRASWRDGNLRLHCDHGAGVAQSLADMGFPIDLTGRSHVNHLGVVQAVMRRPDGSVEAAADAAYDGAAAIFAD